MKRWKRTVNHYTKKNAEGAVIGWIIRIDGRDIPVSKEVYQAYAQGNRKERYMFDERPAITVLSMEKLAEDEVREDYVGVPCTPSCLEIILRQEEELAWEKKKAMLLPALLSLTDEERSLITKLFYDGYTQTELAQELGVNQATVSRRRDAILKKLKRAVEKL